MIQLAQSDDEITACFHAMKLLRAHLDEGSFVPLIREQMRDGYQLAYLRDEDQIACVAGFRISRNLVLGRHLYVDDLSTIDQARSKGLGAQMMSWLRHVAKTENCSVIHLDSGVQRHRAHKFYLNQNMDIVSYHFLARIF